MSLINTGVNYPIERGGSGKFKALSTSTSVSYALSAASPIVLVPARGNAIQLFGLVNVSAGIVGTTISGSLYGEIVSNKVLAIQNTAGYFFIAESYSTSTLTDKILMVSGVPAIQFETDEVVTISTTTVASNNVYLSHVEGYIL